MTGTLIAIPARFAASRFPGKPLELLQGKPMIAWVVERGLQSKVGDVLVATDHDGIAQAAKQAGAQVVMTPSDLPSGTDRVAFACKDRKEDLVINVQGDEPLIDPDHIALAARLLQDNPDQGMSTLAVPLTDKAMFASKDVVKVVLDKKGRALYFSRAPVPFDRDHTGAVPANALRHIGLYGYRRDTLLRLVSEPPAPLEVLEKLEQLRALHLGISIQVGVVDRAAGGVDSPEDLAELEKSLAH